MGLFDVKGLTDSQPSFGLGAPLFDKITIQLNPKYYSGKEFVIQVKGNTRENGYVQQYRLNGKMLHEPRLSFAAFSGGGVLEIEMGDRPKDSY